MSYINVLCKITVYYYATFWKSLNLSSIVNIMNIQCLIFDSDWPVFLCSLKMEAAFSFKTLANSNNTTWYNNPEYHNLNLHHHENLKSSFSIRCENKAIQRSQHIMLPMKFHNLFIKMYVFGYFFYYLHVMFNLLSIGRPC